MKLFFALLLCVAGCTASKTAADLYSAKLKACDDLNTDPPSRLQCIRDVQAQYDDAGAPPATVQDAGGK